MEFFGVPGIDVAQFNMSPYFESASHFIHEALSAKGMFHVLSFIKEAYFIHDLLSFHFRKSACSLSAGSQ